MKTIKLNLLKAGGVFTSIAPLVVVIIINWNEYVMAAGGQTWKLTIGGTIAVVLIALSVLGKMKISGRKTLFTILLVVVFLLEPIIADMKLLCACALGGEILNGITFEQFAKKYQETITMEKQANINAKATEEVLEKIVNKTSGRV